MNLHSGGVIIYWTEKSVLKFIFYFCNNWQERNWVIRCLSRRPKGLVMWCCYTTIAVHNCTLDSRPLSHNPLSAFTAVERKKKWFKNKKKEKKKAMKWKRVCWRKLVHHNDAASVIVLRAQNLTKDRNEIEDGCKHKKIINAFASISADLNCIFNKSRMIV